jgi:hypothetical protein
MVNGGYATLLVEFAHGVEKDGIRSTRKSLTENKSFARLAMTLDFSCFPWYKKLTIFAVFAVKSWKRSRMGGSFRRFVKTGEPNGNTVRLNCS